MMGLKLAIVEWVAANPGRTAREVGIAVGQTARQRVSTLTTEGVLRRERAEPDEHGAAFRYFVAAQAPGKDSGDK